MNRIGKGKEEGKGNVGRERGWNGDIGKGSGRKGEIERVIDRGRDRRKWRGKKRKWGGKGKGGCEKGKRQGNGEGRGRELGWERG